MNYIIVLLLGVFLLFCAMVYDYLHESNNFHHGYCKNCNKKLRYLGTNLWGDRVYKCDKCNHKFSVSWDRIDNWKW